MCLSVCLFIYLCMYVCMYVSVAMVDIHPTSFRMTVMRNKLIPISWLALGLFLPVSAHFLSVLVWNVLASIL